jgi:mannose-6-phosphate isomerase-like protein (cupin superfamily)
MNPKSVAAFVVLAFLSTSALAQSTAPPAQTTPPTQSAPPSKTPPAAKTPPASKPAQPAETPPADTAKPTQGQTPKPTSTTGRRPRTPAQTQVVARDVSGMPLEGVTLAITGAGRQEATTNESGIATLALPDGQYRFRFAHDGFITLEREVTIRNGKPDAVEVALNRAPPAPVAPPPPPAPEPAAAPLRPSGPPAYVFIPAYLEKNFIGRDPLKESVLGCMPDAMARLLQLRETVAQHTHEFDEIIYAIAGDGAVRIGTETITMTPGTLTTIPRGTAHAIERRGRNPLVLLSTVAGTGCPAATTTQAVSK